MKTKVLVILIFLTSIFAGCKPAVEQGLTYDQYINRAVQALQESKNEKAILYYLKALEQRPADANTHYILAQIYDSEYKQSYQEAVNQRLFQLMTHPDPNRKSYNDGPRELKPYGLKVGYDEKAIQEFREAIKYDDKNWQARYRIATDHFNKKHFQEAIEEYKKVIQLNPKYTNSYSLMGEAYMEIGELNLAVETFNTVIKMTPGFDDHDYYKLALVYRKMNNGDKVTQIFKMLKATKSPYFDDLRLALYR